MANIKSEEKLRTLNSNHLAPIVMVTHRTYKFLDIIWNESVPTVEMSWKEFAHGKDFRNGLTEGLDLLESKKSSNWLADLRQLGVVTREDQEWADDVWYADAVARGVKKIAIIMPESAISEMSVTNVVSNLENSEIATRFFDSLEEARAWLSS